MLSRMLRQRSFSTFLRRIMLALIFVVARSAASLSPAFEVARQVVNRKQMTALTMRRSAQPFVFSVSHKAQMLDVVTRSRFADVMKFHFLRNLAVNLLPREAMRQFQLLFNPVPHLTVTVGMKAFLPDNAIHIVYFTTHKRMS